MKRNIKFVFWINLVLFACLVNTSTYGDDENASNELNISLVDAERLAVTNNFDVKIQDMKERILIEGRTEAWRAFLPQLSINYGNNLSVARRSPDSRSHDISFNLKQPIFDGGKTQLQNQLSDLNIILNKQEFELLKSNIILKVRTAFFKLIQAEENLTITKKSIERTMIQLSLTEKENRLGLATRMDLLEIRARLMEIQVEYRKAQKDYEIQSLEFVELLDLSRETHIKIAALPLDEIPVVEIDKPFKDLLSIAYNKRPDIYKNEINLMKSEVEYNIAESQYVPTVSLTSGLSLSGEDFPPKNKNWNIGLVIETNLFGSTASDNGQARLSNNGNARGYNNQTSVNVFNDAGYQKRILESRVAFETSKNEADKLKDNIYIEIKKNYDIVVADFYIQQIAFERKNIVFERLQIETKKAELGELKRVDLMETEMELLKAEQAFSNAKVDYMISVNQLEISMGVNPDFLGLIKFK